MNKRIKITCIAFITALMTVCGSEMQTFGEEPVIKKITIFKKIESEMKDEAIRFFRLVQEDIIIIKYTEAQQSPQEQVRTLDWNENWEYADYSMIHSGSVSLYRSESSRRKNLVIAVNAGHGTYGGESVKTMCHPDGTPKTTGGSTQAGAIYATAVSGGTTLSDGTREADANLALAVVLKDALLDEGYDVLMIREGEDVQLDNIARTVFANNNADCHIALHYDSTENDKGFFIIIPPDIDSYKSMEPVASHWREHNALGDAILQGVTAEGVNIFGNGYMGIDLTQISYSTVPSVDIEVGDRASDHSAATLQRIADGICRGLDVWSGNVN